jgi:type III restriction enzyme
VTPETARLLKHWRQHKFEGIRPFFCQVEAVETAIWLTEVAPKLGARGAKFWTHIKGANEQANPELVRIALKLATGAGKTTVMAMLIAWHTVNAARHPNSRQFSRGFLVVSPGITIRDRLRVLLPNDPESYYRHREIVPGDMLADIDRAKIVITNYHSFRRRERMEVSKVGRALLKGRGPDLETTETEGQMIQRVMSDLMGLKNIVVPNDEAHHCYREKQKDAEDEDLKGEAREEAKNNNAVARLWISGLEMVKRKLGLQAVYDLSATPFFLHGSGYREGTLFPWTVSDFSLMDAIESGIVKLPRIPIADNITGEDMPKFRDLWEHIRTEMPKKGRGTAGKAADPLKLPTTLITALDALYGHYKQTFDLWGEKKMDLPPVFIVVCNNTSTSKLVHDYISGFYREGEDGNSTFENGRLALFRNFDDYGNRLSKPCTLLIDSEQLESGDALDKDFREDAGPEIEQFRREIRERTGDIQAAEKVSDQDLLREVMNTVGKTGTARRIHPLRRVSVDVDRGLGRQYRHPRPRHSRLRDATSLRAGRRSGAASAILQPEREGAVQRRICRCPRRSVQLHGEARCCPAGEATRDRARPSGPARARRPGDQVPARRGLSGGTAGREAHRHLRAGFRPRTESRPRRSVHH